VIRKKETVRLFAKDITGDLVKDRQEVTINWRAGQLVLDEPSFNGGKDIGPDPFTTVLSGLVGCTLTTLRMYVKRKAWDITDIHCSVNLLQKTEPFETSIFRTISFGQQVTDEQKERLLWVARNCPVAKLLQGEIKIDTHLSDDADVPAGSGNYPPLDEDSNHVTASYALQLSGSVL
jgi:putative redox protein